MKKPAVNCVQWLFRRYNPDRAKRSENRLQLDLPPPRMKVAESLNSENPLRMLTKSRLEAAKKYFEQAQLDAETRWQPYQLMASRSFNAAAGPSPGVEPGGAREDKPGASRISKSDPGGAAPATTP